MCVKINIKKMYREDTYKNYRQIYGQTWQNNFGKCRGR